LKFKIMIIRIRTEAYLFYYRLFRIGFNFLKLLLLFVNELAVIDYFTNGRIGIGRNLNQVQIQVISHCNGLSSRINSLLYIVSNQPNFSSSYMVINSMIGFFLFKRWPRAPRSWSF